MTRVLQLETLHHRIGPRRALYGLAALKLKLLEAVDGVVE